MMSRAMRMTGRGDINIARGSLDFTATAVVTESGAKIAGKDLAQLVRAPVPLQVTGLLTSPKYAVGSSR